MNKREQREIIICIIGTAHEKNQKARLSICPYGKDRSLLKDIPIENIQKILNQLESIEHVIQTRVVYRNERYAIPEGQEGDVKWTGPEKFIIKLTDEFDPWFRAYIENCTPRLSQQSPELLKSTRKFLEDIEDLVKVNKSHVICLPINGSIDIQVKAVLELLHSHDVILDYTNTNNSLKIRVDVDRFATFKQKLKERLPQADEPNSIANDTAPSKHMLPKLPPITKWEDVSLKFIDGNNVQIKITDFKYTAHYKELGFEDKRTRSPNAQWQLLEYLARNHGQISWGSAQAHDTVKKKKQRLSKILQAYFNLPADPFYPYKTEEAYTLRVIFHS